MIELTEEMLKSNGWAYQFDLSRLSGNDTEMHDNIKNIYSSALSTLAKQKSKKLIKGPFLIWHCFMTLTGDQNEHVDGYALIVTPHYQEIAGRDIDPLMEIMWQHKGYIRTSSTAPILEGAYPACLFQEGEIYPIELDEEFVSQLSEVFEERQYTLSMVNPGMQIRANPYDN